MGLFRSKRFWMIVYAFLFILSIYWALKAGFSISDWLSLIGSLIFGAVLMFELLNYITKGDERKLEHSEDIVKEIFDHLATNGTVVYDGTNIVFTPVNWIKSTQYSQHLKHRKYQGLCQSYKEAKEYANRKITDIEKGFKQYDENVTQKLEAQIPISASKDYKNGVYYFPTYIKDAIYKDIQIKNHGVIEEKESFEIKYLDSGISQLQWRNQSTVAHADETSLKYLKSVIEKIKSDEKIKSIVLEIEAGILQLKNNTALERFNIERDKIKNQVIKKRKPLEGKCDMCPD